jgi:hypothetical protein
MRVDLGGGDEGVAKHILHRSQVGTIFDKVSSE